MEHDKNNTYSNSKFSLKKKHAEVKLYRDTIGVVSGTSAANKAQVWLNKVGKVGPVTSYE